MESITHVKILACISVICFFWFPNASGQESFVELANLQDNNTKPRIAIWKTLTDFRIWRDKSGKYSVDAKFIGLGDDPGKFRIQKRNGSETVIELQSLSDEDAKIGRQLIVLEYQLLKDTLAKLRNEEPSVVGSSENEPASNDSNEKKQIREKTPSNRNTSETANKVENPTGQLSLRKLKNPIVDHKAGSGASLRKLLSEFPEQYEGKAIAWKLLSSPDFKRVSGREHFILTGRLREGLNDNLFLNSDFPVSKFRLVVSERITKKILEMQDKDFWTVAFDVQKDPKDPNLFVGRVYSIGYLSMELHPKTKQFTHVDHEITDYDWVVE